MSSKHWPLNNEAYLWSDMMAEQIKFPLNAFELCTYQQHNVAVNIWHLKFKNLKFYLSLHCIYSIVLVVLKGSSDIVVVSDCR